MTTYTREAVDSFSTISATKTKNTLDRIAQRPITRNMITEIPDDVGSRFGDLRDLPEELLRQIPATRVDESERQIMEVIKGIYDGVASVDEILVGLYRLTGVVNDRKKLAGKLYRMVSNTPPLLLSVEKRRGVYQIP